MVASLSLMLWPEITKNIIEMSMLVPAGVEAKTPEKAWQEGVEDCISKVRSWPHASQIVWAFLDIGAWILPPLLLKHGFFITDMIDCSHKGRFIIGQGFKCWKFIWRCLLLFNSFPRTCFGNNYKLKKTLINRFYQINDFEWKITRRISNPQLKT